jgi:hypothetical protein
MMMEEHATVFQQMSQKEDFQRSTADVDLLTRESTSDEDSVEAVPEVYTPRSYAASSSASAGEATPVAPITTIDLLQCRDHSSDEDDDEDDDSGED